MMALSSIVGASCVFPSGPSLPLADVAARTQMALIRRHPIYRDRCGIPVKASYFPCKDAVFRADRWCELARAALDELAASLTWHATELDSAAPDCHLYLVLPDSARPGVPADLANQVSAALQHERFVWGQVECINGGHAAGILAVENAAEVVQASPSTLAVVLAVDSWMNPGALRYLEEAQLLHGAHSSYEGRSRANPYGRVPGEGAAAVAIAASKESGADALAVLWGVATDKESIKRMDTKPCLGHGLTHAAKTAVDQSNRETRVPIGHVFTDFNGEPYRADELGFVSLNMAEVLTSEWTRSAPVLASGDLGTASAIAHLALAAYKIHVDKPFQRQMILASSDDELRGAVVLGRSERRTRRNIR